MSLKVLALTRYSRLGASSRMRTLQYVPRLLEHDIDVTVSPLLDDRYITRLYQRKPTVWSHLVMRYIQQFRVLLSAGRYDVLWIEKELFPELPAVFERALRSLGIRYVVDYDDAIFHNYDLSKNPVRRLLSRKIDRVMRNAAVVASGNSYLAARARAAGAQAVVVVPTVIDLQRYSLRPSIHRDQVVIGWIGSPSTVKYLEAVAPILAELAKSAPVSLRVIGADFSYPGLHTDSRKWSETTEVEDIQGVDIGIMPLLDSPWERGKCAYKLIQYMACGLPVVASPVGMNCDVVEHGSSGFLAHAPGEWEQALRTLMGSRELRARMGARGRQLVEEKYCVQVTVGTIANVLRQAALKGTPSCAA